MGLALAAERSVVLADCDVEEPDCRIFIKGEVRSSELVNLPVPVVEEALCTACGECSRFCRYHAIVSLGAAAMVFPELCHGCGGCMMVCPSGAVTETVRRIGTMDTLTNGCVTLLEGRLDVGVAMAAPLVRAVKKSIPAGSLAILDAPPGTSCSMVATVVGADAAVLVTEPTPFGLHDLALAVETTRILGIPFGIAVNRAGPGDALVDEFCAREGIPVLARIPDDRRVAEAYSRGEPVVEALPEYAGLFRSVLENALALSPGKAR